MAEGTLRSQVVERAEGPPEWNRFDGIALIVETADTDVLYHDLIARRLP